MTDIHGPVSVNYLQLCRQSPSDAALRQSRIPLERKQRNGQSLAERGVGFNSNYIQVRIRGAYVAIGTQRAGAGLAGESVAGAKSSLCGGCRKEPGRGRLVGISLLEAADRIHQRAKPFPIGTPSADSRAVEWPAHLLGTRRRNRARVSVELQHGGFERQAESFRQAADLGFEIVDQ